MTEQEIANKIQEINQSKLKPSQKLLKIKFFLESEKQARNDKNLADQVAKDKANEIPQAPDTQKVEIANEKSDVASQFWSMLRGDKGEKGDQGVQGEKGDPGADSDVPGPQGPQGSVGKEGKSGKDGRNGQDSDPEEITNKVLEQIQLPEYKETVLDNGSQIVDKINQLPTDNEEDKIDWSHIKNAPKQKDSKTNGGGSTAMRVSAGQNIAVDSNPYSPTISLSIPIQATAPSNPQVNDLWIDTSA